MVGRWSQLVVWLVLGGSPTARAQYHSPLEVRWETDGLRVGVWTVEFEGDRVEGFRTGDFTTTAPFAPTVSQFFKQKDDPVPHDARKEAGSARWAWTEAKCDDRGGGHGVVVSSVCVWDPGQGEFDICHRLPSTLEIESIPAALQRDPTEQATRLLSKAGRIYVAAPGAGTCSHWTVQPRSCGSAEIYSREDDGDIVSYLVDVSSEHDLSGEGYHPVLIRLGPNVIVKRDKDVLSGSIGSGEVLLLGSATRQYVKVENERWFFDRVTCLQTIAKERSREGPPCRPK